MSKIRYVDELPYDGRVRFAPLLKAIKNEGITGEWGALKSYTNHLSANDAANRLRRNRADFEFRARTGTVYAKYIGSEE